MKKLLSIIFVSLLLSGNGYANHSNYSNCFTQKITEKKFKKYERKSFEEMNNFLGNKNYAPLTDFGIIGSHPTKTFKEISFKNSFPDYLIVVRENEDGSVNSSKRKLKYLDSTKDYFFYNSLVVHKTENIIELKQLLLSGEKFSIFLKCKQLPIKHLNKKKGPNKVYDSHEYYLIILGIISLINFAGIVYLIRRKK